MAGRADAKEMDVDGEDPASRPTGLAGGADCGWITGNSSLMLGKSWRPPVKLRTARFPRKVPELGSTS
jgi:hypothetical protein